MVSACRLEQLELILLTVEDVTRQRETETALQRSEEQRRAEREDGNHRGMSGGTLVHHARLLRPTLKVLLVSRHTEDVLAKEGVGFLQKPYAPAELARKVREVLNSRKDEPS